MSDIATKLTYLNETKSQLKDMINYGLPTENQITNETTFRNYVKGIFEAFIESLRNPDTLFNNLPKKSGNGSQITLNDTANAPMRIELNPTTIIQSPNLFDGNLTSGYIGFDGTIVSSNDWKTSNDYIEIEPNKTYVVSGTNMGARVLYGFYNSSKTFIPSRKETTPNTQFTSVSNAKYIKFSTNSTTPTNIELKGIPTPDTPQDIHTISGDNSVVVEGKNLFYMADGTVTSGGLSVTRTNNKISFVGTATGTYPNTSNSPFSIQAGTYTISTTNTDYDFYLWFRNASGTALRAVNLRKGTQTTTIPDGVTQLAVGVENLTVGTTYNIETYFQIEKGSTATTYTPYVSQTAPINLDTIEYCKIGNYEDEFILTSGKNLFDDTLELGSINGSGYNVTSTTDLRNVNYISVKPNATYTISIPNATRIAIRYYDANKTFLSNGSTNNSPNTFTTPNNCYYARFSFLDQTNTSLLVMLNLGISASSYEPYGTNQWYLKKNIGKVVLDGSESSSLWRLDTSGGFYREAITINGINGYEDSNRHIGRFLCNRFKPDTNNGIGNVLQFKYTLLFYVPSGIAATADWQTWLSNNNVIAYYQLATPTYTQITGTLETQLNNIYEKLLSYKGTTNISQVNNDLPFVLGVSAIQDLK